MKKLRDYQVELVNKGLEIITVNKLLYLSMQVRTGKTATSLSIAQDFGARKVLFLTKKKAMQSVQDDYDDFKFDFTIVIANNESLHKVEDKNFDFVIQDEAHRFGSFPKPCKMAKEFKERFSNLPIILLSGTPYPESFSQIFHQLWISDYSPFKKVNFYNWAKFYVTVKQINFGYGLINDYSNADKEAIDDATSHLFLSYTQEEAGFNSVINEHVLKCQLKESTYSLINKLKKDLVVEGKNETILADTAVKLMQKIHQLSSGTIKFESGNRMVVDNSKAIFIKKRFENKKIGIFYKFTAEYQALKSVFGDELTNDLNEFNSTNKNIALQIISGREGISLAKADYLVYYNIDFSATSYWQSRDRLTTIDRKNNDVYWVFSDRGIEDKIYKSVMNKRNYTLNAFKKDYYGKSISK